MMFNRVNKLSKITLLPGGNIEQEDKVEQLVPLLTGYTFSAETSFVMYGSHQWLTAKVKAFLDCLDTRQ